MSKETKIYVDGSYTTNNPKVTGWGWITEDGTHEDNGALIGDIVSMRQIGGEIKASMQAVAWARSMDYTRIVILYDYEGVAKWANGEWKAKKKWTKEYAKWIQDQRSKGYDIVFEKCDAADNPADALAREITGAKDSH